LARNCGTSKFAATASLSCGRVPTIPPFEELEDELDEAAIDELDLLDDDDDLLEELLLETGLLEELLDTALDELLAAEDEDAPDGAEHSLTPPDTLPPNVASLQTKLPLSTL
jgi:hypothetical protein